MLEDVGLIFSEAFGLLGDMILNPVGIVVFFGITVFMLWAGAETGKKRMQDEAKEAMKNKRKRGTKIKF